MKCYATTLLTLFLFLLFSVVGNAQVKRICVIGSSTSAGYFDGQYPKDSSYVNKLKVYYKSKGLIDTIYNIAVNGTDCYTGMPSSYTAPADRNAPNPKYNITKAINFVPKPDVIIVNYPSNGYNYMSFSEILFCLQTIRDSALANGIECYITTSQPRDNFKENRYRLKTIADSIMNRFGEFAIDFFTDVTQQPEMIIKPEYALGDGVHLNPAGHTVLEQKVIEKNILQHVLALDFLKVETTIKNNVVIVNWQTTDESQVKLYNVQRSTDGSHFTIIGSVNNSNLGQYKFEDATANSGNYFYRIEAIQNNGSNLISKVVGLQFSSPTFQTGKIFFRNNELKVEVLSSHANLTIFLFNMNGQELLHEKMKGKGAFNYSRNFDRLPDGSYQLIVSDGTEKVSKLLIKK